MTASGHPDRDLVPLKQNEWFEVLRRAVMDGHITKVAYVVANDIGNHMGSSSGTCWVGIRGMAKRVPHGKDRIGVAIGELKSASLLLIGHRQGPHGTNVYQATAPVEWVPDSWSQRPRHGKDAGRSDGSSSVPETASSVPQIGLSVPAREGQNGNVNDYDSSMAIAELTEALAGLRNMDSVEDPGLQRFVERRCDQFEQQLSSLTEGGSDER